MKRALALVAGLAGVVGSVVLGVATPASAHNGIGAAFKGPAGPYTVYAYDGYAIPQGQLEYRLVLLERATGEPAEDVNVTVSARPQHGAGQPHSTPADVTNNVVFYALANPYPADWLVTVTLRGRLGTGRVTFPMHGAAPYVPVTVTTTTSGGSGAPVPVIAGAGAGGAAVLGGLGWWFLRRRRRGGPGRATG